MEDSEDFVEIISDSEKDPLIWKQIGTLENLLYEKPTSSKCVPKQHSPSIPIVASLLGKRRMSSPGNNISPVGSIQSLEPLDQSPNREDPCMTSDVGRFAISSENASCGKKATHNMHPVLKSPAENKSVTDMRWITQTGTDSKVLNSENGTTASLDDNCLLTLSFSKADSVLGNDSVANGGIFASALANDICNSGTTWQTDHRNGNETLSSPKPSFLYPGCRKKSNGLRNINANGKSEIQANNEIENATDLKCGEQNDSKGMRTKQSIGMEETYAAKGNNGKRKGLCSPGEHVMCTNTNSTKPRDTDVSVDTDIKCSEVLTSCKIKEQDSDDELQMSPSLLRTISGDTINHIQNNKSLNCSLGNPANTIDQQKAKEFDGVKGTTSSGNSSIGMKKLEAAASVEVKAKTGSDILRCDVSFDVSFDSPANENDQFCLTLGNGNLGTDTARFSPLFKNVLDSQHLHSLEAEKLLMSSLVSGSQKPMDKELENPVSEFANNYQKFRKSDERSSQNIASQCDNDSTNIKLIRENDSLPNRARAYSNSFQINNRFERANELLSVRGLGCEERDNDFKDAQSDIQSGNAERKASGSLLQLQNNANSSPVHERNVKEKRFGKETAKLKAKSSLDKEKEQETIVILDDTFCVGPSQRSDGNRKSIGTVASNEGKTSDSDVHQMSCSQIQAISEETFCSALEENDLLKGYSPCIVNVTNQQARKKVNDTKDGNMSTLKETHKLPDDAAENNGESNLSNSSKKLSATLSGSFARMRNFLSIRNESPTKKSRCEEDSKKSQSLLQNASNAQHQFQVNRPTKRCLTNERRTVPANDAKFEKVDREYSIRNPVRSRLRIIQNSVSENGETFSNVGTTTSKVTPRFPTITTEEIRLMLNSHSGSNIWRKFETKAQKQTSQAKNECPSRRGGRRRKISDSCSSLSKPLEDATKSSGKSKRGRKRKIDTFCPPKILKSNDDACDYKSHVQMECFSESECQLQSSKAEINAQNLRIDKEQLLLERMKNKLLKVHKILHKCPQDRLNVIRSEILLQQLHSVLQKAEQNLCVEKKKSTSQKNAGSNSYKTDLLQYVRELHEALTEKVMLLKVEKNDHTETSDNKSNSLSHNDFEESENFQESVSLISGISKSAKPSLFNSIPSAENNVLNETQHTKPRDGNGDIQLEHPNVKKHGVPEHSDSLCASQNGVMKIAKKQSSLSCIVQPNVNISPNQSNKISQQHHQPSLSKNVHPSVTIYPNQRNEIVNQQPFTFDYNQNHFRSFLNNSQAKDFVKEKTAVCHSVQDYHSSQPRKTVSQHQPPFSSCSQPLYCNVSKDQTRPVVIRQESVERAKQQMQEEACNLSKPINYPIIQAKPLQETIKQQEVIPQMFKQTTEKRHQIAEWVQSLDNGKMQPKDFVNSENIDLDQDRYLNSDIPVLPNFSNGGQNIKISEVSKKRTSQPIKQKNLKKKNCQKQNLDNRREKNFISCYPLQETTSHPSIIRIESPLPTLSELVASNVLIPGPYFLSLYTPNGTVFASLSETGQIIDRDGHVFQSPLEWCESCLSLFVSAQELTPRSAYSRVLYQGRALVSFLPPVSRSVPSGDIRRSQESRVPDTALPTQSVASNSSLIRRHEVDRIESESLNPKCMRALNLRDMKILLIGDDELVPDDFFDMPGQWEDIDEW